MNCSPSPLEGARGYSIPELVVTVAVIALVASIALSHFGSIREASSTSIGSENLAILNAAVLTYNTANRELARPAGSEMTVVTLLQTRDTGLPGSPYLDQNLNFSTTSDKKRTRGVWNGRFFELREAGIDGTGLDLESMH